MFFFVVVHDKKQDHRVIQVEAIRSGLLDVLWTESRDQFVTSVRAKNIR